MDVELEEIDVDKIDVEKIDVEKMDVEKMDVEKMDIEKMDTTWSNKIWSGLNLFWSGWNLIWAIYIVVTFIVPLPTNKEATTNTTTFTSDTQKETLIKWMRPEEIAKQNGFEKPLFFKAGPTRFDVNQGAVGDCWFLAALALLPAHPKVFNNVVCANQTFENNPAGQYIILFLCAYYYY